MKLLARISASLVAASLGLGGVANGADSFSAHEHAHPKHIFGAFVGATDPYKGPTDLTLGIEYEYRFADYVGLGAVLERTPDAHDGDGVDVALFALFAHPFAHNPRLHGLRLTAGAGYEKANYAGSHSADVIRLGASWDIAIGEHFAFAPGFNVDFVGSHTMKVYGLAFVTHF